MGGDGGGVTARAIGGTQGGPLVGPRGGTGIRAPGLPPLPDAASRQAICSLMRRVAGVEIEGDRGAFLRARLASRLGALDLLDFTAYAALLSRDRAEQAFCVEALTTNTTSFFREKAQFDWLRDEGIPTLVEAGAGRRAPLTVWSAACSTGQEGYSALMTVDHTLRVRRAEDLPFTLVGTDISTEVLDHACRGIYSASDVAGVEDAMARRYLMRARTGDGRARIVPELRARSRWQPINLIEAAPSSHAGVENSVFSGVDIAFLRNVLIYFSPETRSRVIAAVVSRLRPSGYLLVGHAEAGAVRHPSLISVRPSIFIKVD